MIENIQHDYFIWEEKNSTEQKKNYENKIANEDCGFITEIKNDSTQKDWKDITDPKLRRKIRDKAWYKANKSKIKLQKKAYYNYNKDKIKLQKKYHCEINKEKLKIKNKTYYESNKDKVKLQKKAYYDSNKDKKKTYQKFYQKTNKDKVNSYVNNRLKTDIQFKLSHNLRARLRSAINRNFKAGSAVKDLGCSIEELKQHLESKFKPGMTWDNWTSNGWHIDHIKPLANFDLTNRQQLLEACHYTNLQPLWADENLSKGKKVEIL
jgi:hypothetical protein